MTTTLPNPPPGTSTKPPQASKQPVAAAGAAARPGFPVSYCNDTFPLLSLAYAIYCGTNQEGTFMEKEGDLARKSFRTVPGFTTPPPTKAIVSDPLAYKGYLDFYLGLAFRKRGGQIVSEDVPVNEEPLWVPHLDRTSPSEDQCKEYVGLVMLELRGIPVGAGEGAAAPANVQRPPRKNASRDDFRPLLSCLSVIFLNSDQTFRANPKAFLSDFEIDKNVFDVLEAYAGRLAKNAGNADPWLTEADAKVIAPKLALELSTRATIW